MKRGMIIVNLAMLCGLAGCNLTRWPLLRGPERSPQPTGETPSVAALVNYLNDNADRVRTLRCEDLDLTCSQGSQSIGLRGKMVMQRPRGLRMSADSLGNRIVDLGSNDQEFWYWVKQAEPPYQFFCAYRDLQEGRVKHMPFPFQPEWVQEALGLGSYGPPERFKLDLSDPETYRLVEQTRSPQGAPVKKIIVLRRRPVNPPTPQATDYILLDETTGKEICVARIADVQEDRATGARVPRRIEFRWPSQRLKMAMVLNGLAVNPSVPATAFVRQPLQGVPSLNLANGQLEGAPGTPLQRVEGTTPR